MRRPILFFVVFLLPSILNGQAVDSLDQSLGLDPVLVDSLEREVAPDPTLVDSLAKAAAKPRFIPKPKHALLWSAIPGGGQVYNRRWWKVPLVYGAFVGLGIAIDYNQGLYRDLREAYLLALAGEEHQFTGTNIDSPNALRNLRDSFDKNTQTAYVGLVILYALQSMEAYVDAHLRSFDVNDDLSFKVKPAMDVNGLTGQPIMGIGISFALGR